MYNFSASITGIEILGGHNAFKTGEKTAEERRHHRSNRPGQQGQNQQDEPAVKSGTEMHPKMTRKEFIDEARKQGVSQDVIDALERKPE